MPGPPCPLPPPPACRAARVRLAASTWTAPHRRSLYYDKDGNESKAYFVQDGLGLKLLQLHGIHPVLDHRAQQPVRAQARRRPRHRYQIARGRQAGQRAGAVCAARRRPGAGGFMGDDLPDLAPLGAVGLAVAPANAHPWIAERVHWQTRADGGSGAARELCDILLAAQGHVDAVPGEVRRMNCRAELAHPARHRPAAGGLLSSWAALRNRDKGPATAGRMSAWTTSCTTSRSSPWMSTARNDTLRAPLLERQRGDQTIKHRHAAVRDAGQGWQALDPACRDGAGSAPRATR